MTKLFIVELNNKLYYTDGYHKIEENKAKLIGTISGLNVYNIVRRLNLEEIK